MIKNNTIALIIATVDYYAGRVAAAGLAYIVLNIIFY